MKVDYIMIVSIRYTEYLILIQGMRETKNKLFKIICYFS